MFFVERLRQIAQVVAAFIDSIAAIAAGADRRRRQPGRADHGRACSRWSSASSPASPASARSATPSLDIVKKIRAPIDKALDRVVEWIVKLGKALVAKAVAAVTGWWKASKSFTTESGEQHTVATKG